MQICVFITVIKEMEARQRFITILKDYNMYFDV